MRNVIAIAVLGTASMFTGAALAAETQQDVYWTLGFEDAAAVQQGGLLEPRTSPVDPDIHATLGLEQPMNPAEPVGPSSVSFSHELHEAHQAGA